MSRFDVVPHPQKPGLSILDDQAMLNSLEITEQGLVELRDFLNDRYPSDLVRSNVDRRERIATAVLATIAADDRCFTGDESRADWNLTVQYRANTAVRFADALIAALGKERRL